MFLNLPGVDPKPPKLKGAAAAAGGLVAGAPNENAGAAVLVGAVLAAGAPKEKPELPWVELPKENPDILKNISVQINNFKVRWNWMLVKTVFIYFRELLQYYCFDVSVSIALQYFEMSAYLNCVRY